MNSPCAADPPLQRHDLVLVDPMAWRDVLARHDELSRESLVVEWADRGWPLVVRRRHPDDPLGLPLGLPLPRALGKRRLPVVVPHDAVVARQPPLALAVAAEAAPEFWQPSIARLLLVAERHGTTMRVFGSLPWGALTGLDYLGPDSDLDLLLALPRLAEVEELTAGLASLADAAPMRLDGELLRRDGLAAHWRELHAGAPELLVKSLSRAALIRRRDFLSEGET